MPLPKEAQPLHQASISDRIYANLRDWIVAGVLLPGESLKDTELAEKLGVSRTPVREALCRLRDEGLVSMSACKWTRVAEISSEEIDQLIPMACSLELLALSQAFPFLENADIERMKAANRQIKKALLNGDFELAAESNRAFHLAFIELSQNPELIGVLQRIRTKLRRMGAFYFKTHRIIPSSTIGEHDALIRALSNRDLEQGKAALAQHWEQVAIRLHDGAKESQKQS